MLPYSWFSKLVKYMDHALDRTIQHAVYARNDENQRYYQPCLQRIIVFATLRDFDQIHDTKNKTTRINNLVKIPKYFPTRSALYHI